MGRGQASPGASGVLYGEPHRRRTARRVELSNPDRDYWLAGDAATWFPHWTGPVDVVLVRVDQERGCAKVEIVTPDISETGEQWEAALAELEPRKAATAPADPADPAARAFEVDDFVLWHRTGSEVLEAVVTGVPDSTDQWVGIKVTQAGHRMRGHDHAISTANLEKR